MSKELDSLSYEEMLNSLGLFTVEQSILRGGRPYSDLDGPG